MPHAHITKIEDARTGQWLRHLDPITDPIKRIDMGWTMGDWNQLDVTTETVGLREFSSSSFLLLPSSFFLLPSSPISYPLAWVYPTLARYVPPTRDQ
jgi:hypothetical protein